MIHRSYDQLTDRLRALAESPNIDVETLGEVFLLDRVYPLYLMRFGTPDASKIGVTISAGMHGDEPAGVEAAVRFLEVNAKNDDLLRRFHFIIFPCDNPSGYELNTRENALGIDLNRQFGNRKPAREVELISGGLRGRCFDLVFETHEDIDSPGFYLYELADDPKTRVGNEIVQAVADMGVPINLSGEIEGMPAKGGVISPRGRRFRKTHLPKAVYTYKTCGGHVITLEPPVSVLPFEDRVNIQLTALNIALQSHLR